ncbi:hypothetical protein NW762_003464 [Fusarium torreyae]|uniref:Transmembrane protein 53 n=1 Tax=Fusarium torreyae TaxID=1237075 RepID=A0A9W8S7R8_9HYPO|nr:hypothetical protein NW762_003464 [Fusarium torreyae]
MAANKESPLAHMDKLSPAVSYLQPNNESTSTLSKSSSGHDPQLIVILGWMGARDVHLAKYISQYRTLFPTSPILLFRNTIELYMRPALRRRLFAPALPVLQSVSPTKDSEPSFLLHVFSNGGVGSAVTLWELWETALGDEPVPRHAVVMDSCPGYFNWKRNHHVVSVTLPSYLSPLVWVFLAFAWVYYTILLRMEPHETNASALNTTERISRETKRAYLYGDADRSVAWEDIEFHARQAKERGAVVRTEKFAGGAHVSHIRIDAGRYWNAVQETWE